MKGDEGMEMNRADVSMDAFSRSDGQVMQRATTTTVSKSSLEEVQGRIG